MAKYLLIMFYVFSSVKVSMMTSKKKILYLSVPFCSQQVKKFEKKQKQKKNPENFLFQTFKDNLSTTPCPESRLHCIIFPSFNPLCCLYFSDLNHVILSVTVVYKCNLTKKSVQYQKFATIFVILIIMELLHFFGSHQ